jgi:type II secretory pathway component PulF
MQGMMRDGHVIPRLPSTYANLVADALGLVVALFGMRAFLLHWLVCCLVLFVNEAYRMKRDMNR